MVLVVVDDMDDFACAATSAYLPRSSRWLRDQRRCFEIATATTPVCCPARAELQTGQLPHNDWVPRQQDASKLDPVHTIQHQLGAAGLETYGIGKFLNAVDPADLATGIAFRRKVGSDSANLRLATPGATDPRLPVTFVL